MGGVSADGWSRKGKGWPRLMMHIGRLKGNPCWRCRRQGSAGHKQFADKAEAKKTPKQPSKAASINGEGRVLDLYGVGGTGKGAKEKKVEGRCTGRVPVGGTRGERSKKYVADRNGRSFGQFVVEPGMTGRGGSIGATKKETVKGKKTRRVCGFESGVEGGRLVGAGERDFKFLFANECLWGVSGGTVARNAHPKVGKMRRGMS